MSMRRTGYGFGVYDRFGVLGLVDTITLAPGDNFLINASWQYLGPALSGTHQIGLMYETYSGSDRIAGEIFAWDETGTTVWVDREIRRTFVLPTTHSAGTFNVKVAIVDLNVTAATFTILATVTKNNGMIVTSPSGVRDLAWQFEV